jgi:hypothetical protein
MAAATEPMPNPDKSALPSLYDSTSFLGDFLVEELPIGLVSLPRRAGIQTNQGVISRLAPETGTNQYAAKIVRFGTVAHTLIYTTTHKWNV